MVFLLLVFFMTVSTLAKADRSIEVDLAESSTSEVPEVDALDERFTVTLTESGGLYIGERSTPHDILAERLLSLKQERGFSQLNIRADGKTPYSAIDQVLTIASEAGIAEVVYATFQAQPM